MTFKLTLADEIGDPLNTKTALEAVEATRVLPIVAESVFAAIVDPVAEDLFEGDLLNTITNYSAYIDTANFSSSGGAIVSAVMQVNGVAEVGTYAFVAGDAVRNVVTDASGGQLITDIDTSVGIQPPVAAGGLVDQSFASNTGVQTYDASGDFTGASLTFDLTAFPSGVSINPSTGLVSHDTDAMSPQTASSVVVRATNASGAATSGYSLDITSAETTITSFTTFGQTGGADGPVSFEYEIDADDQINYLITDTPQAGTAWGANLDAGLLADGSALGADDIAGFWNLTTADSGNITSTENFNDGLNKPFYAYVSVEGSSVVVPVTGSPFTIETSGGLTVPSITGSPSISGTIQEGETVSVTPAASSGNPSPTQTYEWFVNGVSQGAPSATTTFLIPASTAGQTLRVDQIATNSQGSDTASSANETITAAGGSTSYSFFPIVQEAGNTASPSRDIDLSTGAAVGDDVYFAVAGSSTPNTATLNGKAATLVNQVASPSGSEKVAMFKRTLEADDLIAACTLAFSQSTSRTDTNMMAAVASGWTEVANDEARQSSAFDPWIETTYTPTDAVNLCIVMGSGNDDPDASGADTYTSTDATSFTDNNDDDIVGFQGYQENVSLAATRFRIDNVNTSPSETMRWGAVWVMLEAT